MSGYDNPYLVDLEYYSYLEKIGYDNPVKIRAKNSLHMYSMYFVNTNQVSLDNLETLESINERAYYEIEVETVWDNYSPILDAFMNQAQLLITS